jgi:hypothetical protein
MPTEREFEICAELNLLPEHLYEANEAAARLGITEAQLVAAMRLGKIQCVDGGQAHFRGWHIAEVLVR